MPHITNQEKLIEKNTLSLVSKGPLNGAWRCEYLKCPICNYYVLKGKGYDECTCGNINIDSDMLRVSINVSSESEIECYNSSPKSKG